MPVLTFPPRIGAMPTSTFPSRVGGDAHIAPLGTTEFAENFRKISSICRGDVGIAPYANLKILQKREEHRPDAGRCSFLSAWVSAEESVQHSRDLCACSLRGGQKLPVRALHEACAASPLHGGNCIPGNRLRIVEAQDVRVLADAHIVPLVVCIAVENRRQLLAGDVVVGAEGLLGIAGHNAVCRRPANSLAVPRIFHNIAEAHRKIHNRRALEPPENRDNHGARRGNTGCEDAVCRTVHEAGFIDVAHVVIEPVAASHIVEGQAVVGSRRGLLAAVGCAGAAGRGNGFCLRVAANLAGAFLFALLMRRGLHRRHPFAEGVRFCLHGDYAAARPFAFVRLLVCRPAVLARVVGRVLFAVGFAAELAERLRCAGCLAARVVGDHLLADVTDVVTVLVRMIRNQPLAEVAPVVVVRIYMVRDRLLAVVADVVLVRVFVIRDRLLAVVADVVLVRIYMVRNRLLAVVTNVVLVCVFMVRDCLLAVVANVVLILVRVDRLV